MKYLDYPILTYLSDTLSNTPTPEYRVHVKFEAYSVKPIGKERKMFKEMEEAYLSGQEEMDEMSFSPEMRGLSSCFGRLDEKESRKVHFLLVSTLNSAYPDHDFSSLRPDQFTREPNAGQVLGSISTTLAPPLSPEPNVNPDLYRVLNDVIPLDECEVYSWFPEPEYDPHLEDGESEFEVQEEVEDETPASWGQAGMDLDDVPESVPMAREDSTSGQELGSAERSPGLLWSLNYFFYSKRQKRVLFLNCWCRRRPSQMSSPPEDDSFPMAISSSFGASPASVPSPVRNLRQHRGHNRSNARPRKAKITLKGDLSSTIPIRGMETPPPRLASSAPSAFPTPSPQAALAKMTAGGFRPRQTPARVLINAAAASNRPPEDTGERVRKDRSESTTPGPSRPSHLASVIKGKRVKL